MTVDVDQPVREPARLYCLVAREASKAVIFRRGPSRLVRLLSWDLETDEITPGQWIKGRIYERRADLSPDGALLVYFAAKFSGPLYAYTVLSRPPWLTAIALTPQDHTWGGGGLFLSKRKLLLNKMKVDPISTLYGRNDRATRPKGRRKVPRCMREESLRPWEDTAPVHKGMDRDAMSHASHRPFDLAPGALRGLQIDYVPDERGLGEDEPLLGQRHARDGWTVTGDYQRGIVGKSDLPVRYPYDPPYARAKPIGQTGLILKVLLHGVGAHDGGWYYETGQIETGEGLKAHDFGRIDWADCDHNGDVLAARAGCLFRFKIRLAGGEFQVSEKCIIDLNDMRFSPIRSPAEARRWP